MLLHLGAVLVVVSVATLTGHPKAPAYIAQSAAVSISVHPAAAHVPEYTVRGSSGLPAGHMHAQLAPYVPHAAVAPPWLVLKYVPAYDRPAAMLLHLGAELVVVSVATLTGQPKAPANDAHSAAVWISVHPAVAHGGAGNVELRLVWTAWVSSEFIIYSCLIKFKF